MTFLILTDCENFTNSITTKIKELEKSAKIYKSDFSESNLKKVKKYIPDLSICLSYSEKKSDSDFSSSEIAEISLLCGNMISSEIPVATNFPFLANQKIFGKTDIVSLKDTNEFLKYIEKKYDYISMAHIKRNSKKTLLEKGIPFTSDCFATYIAKNKTEICDLFITGGIDINSCDELGTPMLNIAVRNENEEITKMLLELGANINAVSQDRGYTALMDAVWKGNKSITALLISKGADLNTISKEGQTNLVLAVGADRIEIVKLLAENGGDPDIKDQMGMSAYGYATLFRKEKIVEILKPYHKE